MRDMVLKNQVVLGTVNAGPDSFAAAVQHLAEFHRHWPEVTQTLTGDRYPLDEAAELVFGRPTGIKTVISF
jgi:hypothetical protein